MKTLHSWVIIFLLFILSCNVTWAQKCNVNENIITANNDFAYRLYSALKTQSDNLVVSPFSVNVGLLMVYAGSRGSTATQIANVFNSPAGDNSLQSEFSTIIKQICETNSSDNELTLADSIWGQNGFPFLEAYESDLNKFYDAPLHQVDLTGWPGVFDSFKAIKARDKINAWVSDKTHGQIKELLSDDVPTPNTRLILTEAAYFKAPWALPFFEGFTSSLTFFTHSDQSNRVSTMQAIQLYNYAEDAEMQALEIPYLSGNFSMFIFLPRMASNLPNVEANLNRLFVEKCLKNAHETNVWLCLPKFKVTSFFNLKTPLQALGVMNIFSRSDADLSGISLEKPLYIDTAIQKTCISVNEIGTEASTATIFTGEVGADPIHFNVNHPFLFIIRHNPTGAIIFIGRITSPSL